MADSERFRPGLNDLTGWLFIAVNVLTLAIGLYWLLGDGDPVLAWVLIATAVIVIPMAVAELKPVAQWRRARRRRTESRLLATFLAANGPLSGYEACERSGLGPGSLYPLLERWAESGFVAFERGDPVSAEPGAPRLGMYQLTSAGIALAKGRTEGTING